MSKSKNEISQGQPKTVATIGKSSQELSFQEIQDIYRELLGKNEVATHAFFDAHIVSSNDLQHLNDIIVQTIEPFSKDKSDCSVSVSWANDEAEGFSSFEQFLLKGLNRVHPVRFLEINYNFLIQLPKTREARAYTFSINIRSMAGECKRLESIEATEAEWAVLHSYNQSTAFVRISYVDLAVQRNLKAQFETWYSSVKKTKPNGLMKFLDRQKNYIFSGIRLLSILVAAFLVLLLDWFNVFGTKDFYRTVSMFIALFSAFLMSAPVAKTIEKKISARKPQSIILLSVADEDLIDEKRESIFLISTKLVFGILMSVFCSLAATFIAGIFFTS